MAKRQPSPGIARSRAQVTPARLSQLNAGQAASATLVEALVIDFALLMRNALPGLSQAAAQQMAAMAGDGITRRMAAAGALIRQELGYEHALKLAAHPSDTVRGWACYVIGQEPRISLKKRLAAIKPLADDPHFGVREWAWMAVRPQLALEVDIAIALLTPWAKDGSERVRRFACEAIRPRGVWCAHIQSLRQQPEMALPILEKLNADDARYVQDSVGNWLNDAGKDKPAWVKAVCQRWLSGSDSRSTQYICRRAMRSLNR